MGVWEGRGGAVTKEIKHFTVQFYTHITESWKRVQPSKKLYINMLTNWLQC